MTIKGISPKLTAAIAPPLTAVISAIILTGAFDRTSAAALAAVVIAAALGWHAPAVASVALSPPPLKMAPIGSTTSTTGGSSFELSAVHGEDFGTEPDPADPALNADPEDTDGADDHPVAP